MAAAAAAVGCACLLLLLLLLVWAVSSLINLPPTLGLCGGQAGSEQHQQGGRDGSDYKSHTAIAAAIAFDGSSAFMLTARLLPTALANVALNTHATPFAGNPDKTNTFYLFTVVGKIKARHKPLQHFDSHNAATASAATAATTFLLL